MKFNPGLSLPHLLQQCTAAGAHHRHLAPIHALSIVSGHHLDLYLNNNLLNAYSKSGHTASARQLFDQMPHRNLISYSSMISMFSQHNLNTNALSLFAQFRNHSPDPPNGFILASVLRACTQSKSTLHATQVHCLVTKSGFISDIYVGTALVNFYSKMSNMEGAGLLFRELPVRNSVGWTAMITGYSRIGMDYTAIELFRRMWEEGVEPDRFVLSSVVCACAAVEFVEGGRQIHGYVYRRGTAMDVSVSNVIVDLYCKCSRVGVARRVFDRMGGYNLVSWTTMIAGYMQNSFDLEAMCLFYEMGNLGWRPDGFACNSVLSSCGSLVALEQGQQVHGYAIKANLESDEYVGNGLIDMYAKCGSLGDARFAFDGMVEHNVISYNTMIEGYARHEELAGAVFMFERMRSRSLRPSLLTFVSLLGVSTSSEAVDLSKQIHSLTIKVGFSLDLYTGTALVDGYSKCACVYDARAVFDEMDERDLVVWNAMLFGYTQNGEVEEALKLFHQLRMVGIRPTEFTYVALVTVASNLASLFHGLQFHSQITKAGVDFDPHVSNALIDMYAKCGCIREAWILFKTARGRDISCWNTMISRYAQHGLAEEALRVFDMMRAEDIEPNYITFVGVLSACSHVGLVEEGLHHFHSMKYDFGIEPGMEHYASVVSILGLAGRLHEAKEFIEEMPIEPTANVWRSFLSACRVFGNVELGRYAAEMAISLDPRDSGARVLLSNIFASQGMWRDAEEVRKEMDNIGVVKDTGYSWIEVMKEVHIFIATGREHPQIDQIYSMLDELTHMIDVVGYLPDTMVLSINDGND